MKLTIQKPNIFYSSLIIGQFIIILAMILTPVQSVILPIGEDVCKAYSLLESTKSGKDLIQRVKNSSRGNYIFLTLGETEREKLKDYSGKKVRGLTRVTTSFGDINFRKVNVSVITNRDVTGDNPLEIVKNMAFELENVVYIYQNPGAEPPKDGPQCHATQKAVMEELRRK